MGNGSWFVYRSRQVPPDVGFSLNERSKTIEIEEWFLDENWEGDKICLTGRRLIEKSPWLRGKLWSVSELDSVGDDRWGWVTLKNPQPKNTRPDNRYHGIKRWWQKFSTIRGSERKQSCFNSMLFELINCDRSIMVELRINIIRNFNLINFSAWLILICAVII